ncbi:MAG: VOC family protein [Burkholderiales bacterium]|nr:VOC family protein [Burkholderiales bacterium]
MITGLSHVSIAVPSLAGAAERLKELYGLAAGEAVVNEEQGIRLAYVDLGNARIELMEPARPDSSISKFLEHHPAGGIHHFCLNVDGLVPAAAAITAKGARVLGAAGETRNVHGELIAFVHPKDFLGALVELEERSA